LQTQTKSHTHKNTHIYKRSHKYFLSVNWASVLGVLKKAKGKPISCQFS